MQAIAAEGAPIAYSSNEKGRHAELIAQTALLANGYTVMEPIAPEAFDLAIKRPDGGDTSYVQVKTAMLRDEPRYGGKYLVIRGAKNNGARYTRDEVDYFVAIWQGRAYMFPNSEQSEYWVKPDEIGEKWTELSVNLL